MTAEEKKAARLQKRWLSRRTCGWCAAKCTASRCQAIYREKCDIEKQRAIWLQSYHPRTLLQKGTQA